MTVKHSFDCAQKHITVLHITLISLFFSPFCVAETNLKDDRVQF